MMDQQKDVETLASSSKLNAKAPEFVPRSASSISQTSRTKHMYGMQSFSRTYYGYENQLPAQNYFQVNALPDYKHVEWTGNRGSPVTATKNGLSDSNQKILSQVEFYFSDINLATTDQLFRLMCKDSEAYVPLSVVASFKKIKTAVSGVSELASILRSSEILVVSEDGKKVKRKHPLSELDMEELQSRIVIAENLPEDHSHSNLVKIFSSVGSVKSIRISPPQNPNGGASSASRTGKGDGFHLSSKFQAFVEYESVDAAEKAVTELSEEGNWRNGLRVRFLIKNVVKSTPGRTKKVCHEGEPVGKKPDEATQEMQYMKENHFEDSPRHSDTKFPGFLGTDKTTNDSQRRGPNGVTGKGKGKGVNRGQGRQPVNGGNIWGSLPVEVSITTEKLPTAKLSTVPRMPDGTKGFSFGRGKPIALEFNNFRIEENQL